MRQDQRHRKVKKMATIRENSTLDHRPKTIWNQPKRHRDTQVEEKKCEKSKLGKKLKITENKDIFRECVNQEIHTRKDEKNVINLEWIANILTSVVRKYAAWKRTTQSHGSRKRG